jgi:hypothetical protein
MVTRRGEASYASANRRRCRKGSPPTGPLPRIGGRPITRLIA